MTSFGNSVATTGQSGALRTTLWLALALLACFSVLILNGRPLFYFDTVGYMHQGLVALQQLGLIDPSTAPSAADAAAGTNGGAVPETGAKTVDGSRSLLYALVAGLLAHLHALELLVVIHALAVLMAFWLTMRVARRVDGPVASLAALTSMPVIAAVTGSMPFFVAYLMPDIFAPVLILCIGTLTVFARQMRWWEIVLTLGLGSFAVMSHLSHVPIAALLVPASALVSLILGRRRWWLAPALVALIVGVALAQQAAFRVAAKAVSDSEVIIKPFITARLVQDGPGYDYLERHCPDEAIATCPLWTALHLSDDPYRLTASHIIFETSARLGSFRLMSEADQLKVVNAQEAFFFDVLREAPIDTIWAFAANTAYQTRMFSIEMTLPGESIVARHVAVGGLAFGNFALGRMSEGAYWLPAADAIHTVVYMLSALILAAAVLARRQVPVEIRALVVMVVFGILANALVCGGISQPASRYGARVAWLLPAMVAVVTMFRRRTAE
jgi:hypothetical protein